MTEHKFVMREIDISTESIKLYKYIWTCSNCGLKTQQMFVPVKPEVTIDCEYYAMKNALE